MKSMKFVKMFAVLLCMAIAVCCTLTGCGDDESKASEASASGAEEVCDKIMKVFFDDSAKSYYGYSLKKLNGEFGGLFTEEKADDAGEGEYYYKIGKVNKLFGGKVDLDDDYEVGIEFDIEDEEGLMAVKYRLSNVNDTGSLSRKITGTLDKKLPSDWDRKGTIGDDYKFMGKDGLIKLDVKPDSMNIVCSHS